MHTRSRPSSFPASKLQGEPAFGASQGMSRGAFYGKPLETSRGTFFVMSCRISHEMSCGTSEGCLVNVLWNILGVLHGTSLECPVGHPWSAPWNIYGVSCGISVECPVEHPEGCPVNVLWNTRGVSCGMCCGISRGIFCVTSFGMSPGMS